ncbi:hypothetical protein VRY54_03125 [Actinomyces sp. F1_1611]
MISKVFKQDYLDSRRLLSVILGSLFLVVVVSSLMVMIGNPILMILFMVLGVLAATLIIPGALLGLAYNYWQSMYGRRGYFTFTLPIPGRQLAIGKVLYGFAAAAVSLVLTGLSILILVAGMVVGQRATWADAGNVWREILTEMPAPVWWFILISVVFGMIVTIIDGAAILSIGAQSRYNSLGIGAPIIGGIIYYVILQVLTLAAMALIPISLVIYGPDAGQIVFTTMLHDTLRAIEHGDSTSLVGLGSYLVNLVVTVCLALWGINAVEKHTSLR